jgi:hypothetical protein
MATNDVLARNEQMADRFLQRLTEMSPDERRRISTALLGTPAHSNAVFAMTDAISLSERKLQDDIREYLAKAEQQIAAMDLDSELSSLVKHAVRGILVRDLLKTPVDTRELYAPFETVIPQGKLAPAGSA